MPLLLLAYLGFVSVGLPDGMLGVAWPHMQGAYRVSVESVGLLLFAGTAAYTLSGVSAGFLVRRAGVGRLLAASTALAATALAGFAFSPGLVLAVVAAGLLGFGSGAIDAGLNAYTARHFGARHMNWLHASYSFGATLGPLVVTAALALGLTWRGGYGAVATGQLLLATAFVLTTRAWLDRAAVPSAPVAPAAAPAPVVTAPVSPAPPAATPRVRRTLALTGTWLGAVAFGLYVAVELGAGLWAYTLLTQERGIGEGLAGVAVAGYWASLFVGRLLVGFVVDRIGTHRVLAGSLVGVIVGAAVVTLPGPAAVTVVGLLLVGLACASVFPLLMLTTAQRVGPAHADRAIGIQVGAAALGGAGFPALIGVLIGAWGPAVLGPSLLVLGVGLTATYLVAHPGRVRGRPIAAPG